MADEARQRYERAQHAMQSGVAQEMNIRPHPTQPKFLRVGVNTAMSDHAALARLLVEKGVITEDDYMAALADEMEREVTRYEQSLSAALGAKIALA